MTAPKKQDRRTFKRTPRKPAPKRKAWDVNENGFATYTFPSGKTSWMGIRWLVDLLNKAGVDIRGRVDRERRRASAGRREKKGAKET